MCARAENGPFKITEDLTLRDNEYGWDQAASMIFVDQPINTGCTSSPRHQGLVLPAVPCRALWCTVLGDKCACGVVRIFILR